MTVIARKENKPRFAAAKVFKSHLRTAFPRMSRAPVAAIESGELKIDDESKEAAWVPLSSAAELPLADSQRRRLKDVLEYQKERRTFLR